MSANSLILQYIVRDSWWQAIRRRVWGTLAIAAALALGIVFSIAVQYDSRDESSPVNPIAVAVALAAAVAAPILLRLGLGLMARSGRGLIDDDTRPPVLYLRSFQDDARIVDRRDWKRLIWFPSRYETPERALARAVADVGPLVAIGKPGELLRPSGAARLYVDADRWQEVVAQLVTSAQFVILRIGQTEGFWWELRHLVERCDPRKVLIYLPRTDRKEVYQSFRQRAAQTLPCPMPEQPGRAWFLAFAEGWQPRLLGSQGASVRAWYRWLAGGSHAPRIREALNETVGGFGRATRRMPVGWAEGVALVGLVPGVLCWIAAIPLMMIAARERQSILLQAEAQPAARLVETDFPPEDQVAGQVQILDDLQAADPAELFADMLPERKTQPLEPESLAGEDEPESFTATLDPPGDKVLAPLHEPSGISGSLGGTGDSPTGCRACHQRDLSRASRHCGWPPPARRRLRSGVSK